MRFPSGVLVRGRGLRYPLPSGTALACMAVLDGVPPEQAVAFVRQHYHPRAVETPWQRPQEAAQTGGVEGVHSNRLRRSLLPTAVREPWPSPT
ncbi:hypothetical protein [Streptomyces sp. NPDC096339]|uniref:hypothetical protein n=1 Tax=Streptomyces sp. NPDC096339 TaxID=3366086 RepID=UPI00381ECE6C